MIYENARMNSLERMYYAGLNNPSACTLQRDHTNISDERNERNNKWDKHTSKRPGSDEKKKNESKGWFKRNPPKKKKDDKK